VMAGGGVAPQQSQFQFTLPGFPKRVWILRPITNTSVRAKVPLNLQRIIAGEANDTPLFPNDILYIPRNGSGELGRTLLVALPTALGLVDLALTLAHL
jgi:hypothetical protein